LITMFVVGVNVSPTFAETVSKIGFLRQLAEVVNFNEGFKDAVENEYITEVNKVEKTSFADIELSYFIADEKNMVLFLKADNVKDDIDKNNMYVEFASIKNTDTGEFVEGIGGEIPSFDEEYVAVNMGLWPDGFEYPDNLEVTFEIGCSAGEELVSFNLEMPEPLEERVYEIHEEIEHRGQKITVRSVTVYPTCTYIEYSENPNNNMDILNIDFHLVDEKGVERGNERTYTYFDDNGMYIASGYFALEGDLSLVLDKLYLLPKEKRTVKYNVDTKEFSDCDGVLDYIRIIDESDSLYQDYIIEDDVMVFTIDREDVKESRFANSFSEMDSKTGEFLDTWIGTMWIEDETYHTMPNTVKVDEDREVTLYREYAEFFDEPNIVLPIK